MDPVRKVGLRRGAGEQLDLSRGLVPAQRCDVQRGHARVTLEAQPPLGNRGRCGWVLDPVGADQRRLGRTGGDEVLDQVERRGVRPVQVLDDQGKRSH